MMDEVSHALVPLQELTDNLPAVLPSQRELGGAPGAPHLAQCLSVPALRLIEVGGSGRSTCQRRLTVATWNVERCKFPAQSVNLLRSLNVDVLLLSELDVGMARSGNISAARLLADELGMSYSFGVEFIEFGHGNQTERVIFHGQVNENGFHGNAILAVTPQRRPSMLRLPGGEKWRNLDWHDDRLGSRIALFSELKLNDESVLFVSLHLESLPTALDRCAQFECVLKAIDLSYSGMPVVIGGDFNTAELPEAQDEPELMPYWFMHPDEWEPLFAVARSAGYNWILENTAQHTRRQLKNGWPRRPFKKLDWFFTKGLEISQPKVISAVSQQGDAISDHEILILTVELPRRI